MLNIYLSNDLIFNFEDCVVSTFEYRRLRSAFLMTCEVLNTYGQAPEHPMKLILSTKLRGDMDIIDMTKQNGL